MQVKRVSCCPLTCLRLSKDYVLLGTPIIDLLTASLVLVEGLLLIEHYRKVLGTY